MDLTTVKDVSIIVAGAVALVTIAMGAVEYRRKNRWEKTEQFVQLRRRFLENDRFRGISTLLATDSPELAKTPIQDRRNYVGFLEEVALLVNSGVVRLDVAHYMFGYYVLLTDSSRHFWEDLDRGSPYWSVFRAFAATMRARAEVAPDPRRLEL